MNQNPYNPKNISLNKEWLQTIFHKFNISHKINDINLFKNAFTHKSYCYDSYTDHSQYDKHNDCLPLCSTSYERLEFLGDSILDAIIAEYLFKRFNCDERLLNKNQNTIS